MRSTLSLRVQTLTSVSLTIVSLLLSAAFMAGRARAQESWAIDRMAAQDIAPGTAETFRQILRSKLAAATARATPI